MVKAELPEWTFGKEEPAEEENEDYEDTVFTSINFLQQVQEKDPTFNQEF